MKKLLLLSLSIIILNCSKNDDNSNDNSNLTFLENYKNTGWRNVEDKDFLMYARFVDNQDIIIENWLKNYPEDDCFWYGFLTEDVGIGGNLEIIENEGNILKLSITNDVEFVIYTFTVSNNKLTSDIEWNDGEIQHVYLYFETTSDDLDALNKCVN